MLTTIGFDADDTLWQNEAFFRLTQDHFTRLLADHAPPDHLAERLEAAAQDQLAQRKLAALRREPTSSDTIPDEDA